MEILEIMGKVAGIGGLALGTLLLLFRDVIRKNIFSNLTRDQSYRLIRLILILVWSIALAGIAAWLVGPRLAQAPTVRSKVVVTMDSPLLVYDEENNGTGRTNTDEIDDILKDIKQVSLAQVGTNRVWNRDEEVRSKNPDLVILHMSAFAGETLSHEDPAALTRLVSFFRYMKDTKAKFLVYSRSPSYNYQEVQMDFVAQVERQIPELKNRIQFFNFVPGKPKRFRDLDAQVELKNQVRSLLGV